MSIWDLKCTEIIGGFLIEYRNYYLFLIPLIRENNCELKKPFPKSLHIEYKQFASDSYF